MPILTNILAVQRRQMGVKAFWDTLPGLEKIFIGFGIGFVIWSGVGILKGLCFITISYCNRITVVSSRFNCSNKWKTLLKASQKTTITAPYWRRRASNNGKTTQLNPIYSPWLVTPEHYPLKTHSCPKLYRKINSSRFYTPFSLQDLLAFEIAWFFYSARQDKGRMWYSQVEMPRLHLKSEFDSELFSRI